MILSANQPYFIPYLGYWQLINMSDMHLIADDYNYIVRGWIERNRILSKEGPVFFGINVNRKSSNKLISETQMCEIPVKKKMDTIFYTYAKAPFYPVGRDLMEDILTFRTDSLIDFLMHSHKVIMEYLDIDTPLRLTSSIEGNSNYKFDERIFHFCSHLGADTYVNAIGGTKLYSAEKFRENGIKLKFIKSNLPEYKQFNNTFVPGLSIIDVIMFNSKEDCKKMLSDFSLIDETNINEYIK